MTAFAQVYLTERDGGALRCLGLYIATEIVDEAFVRERFGAPGCLITKPQAPLFGQARNWSMIAKRGVPETAATAAERAHLGTGAARPKRLRRAVRSRKMQRGAIARALVHRPSLLLADEPPAILIQRQAKASLRCLRNCTRAACIIIVTHNPDRGGCCQRWIALTDGRLIGAGPSSHLTGAIKVIDHCPPSIRDSAFSIPRALVGDRQKATYRIEDLAVSCALAT